MMKRTASWIPALVLLGILLMFSPDCGAQEKTGPAKETPAQSQTAKENTASVSDGQKYWIGEVLFYVPNRIMDALDIFTLNLKGGAVFELDLRLTRAFCIGAGWGPALMLCKDYNRQYGTAFRDGWYLQFGFLQAENTEWMCATGTVRNYWESGSNFPTVYQSIYQCNTRDYWEIGASASCIFGVDFFIHPLEVADFLCGIFLLDNVLPQPPFIHDSIPLKLMMF